MDMSNEIKHEITRLGECHLSGLQNDRSVFRFLYELKAPVNLFHAHCVSLHIFIAFSNATVVAIVFTDIGKFDDATKVDAVSDVFFPDYVCLGEECFLQGAFGVEVLPKA